MNKRSLYILVALVILVVGIVNATVFAYRWITGTVAVDPPMQAKGVACTGFYSSALQSGINLPPAGTNYNAPTYGGNSISITQGQVVCEWSIGDKTYRLFESIDVSIGVTVGSWYIQDFYGFGYNGSEGDPNVYVYFKVEQPVKPANTLSEAMLIIYNGTAVVASLNLMEANIVGPIILKPGEGLRLDLKIDAATSSNEPVTFKVGVYVTQEANEQPRSSFP